MANGEQAYQTAKRAREEASAAAAAERSRLERAEAAQLELEEKISKADPEAKSFGTLVNERPVAAARVVEQRKRVAKAEQAVEAAMVAEEEAYAPLRIAKYDAALADLDAYARVVEDSIPDLEAEMMRQLSGLESRWQLAKGLAEQVGQGEPRRHPLQSQGSGDRGEKWRQIGAGLDAVKGWRRQEVEEAARLENAQTRAIAMYDRTIRGTKGAASACYLVTIPPGVPVPGVGFVKPGEAFWAESGYKPSRTFVPLNDVAHAAMSALRFKVREIPKLSLEKPPPVKEKGLTLRELEEEALAAHRSSPLSTPSAAVQIVASEEFEKHQTGESDDGGANG
jgi:hypothetical protein